MRTAVPAAVLLVLVFATGARAQDCASGSTPTAEQKARRSTALALVRAINTAESAFASRNDRRYGTLEELLESGVLKPMLKNTPLNFTTDEPLVGWKLEFSSNPEGYAFLLKDKTDPCGFAFFSTQDGLIFEGQLIR